jgi:hypothetical protein
MYSKLQNSRISLNIQSCKSPTNLTLDGCSEEALALECLNDPQASSEHPSSVKLVGSLQLCMFSEILEFCHFEDII